MRLSHTYSPVPRSLNAGPVRLPPENECQVLAQVFSGERAFIFH